MKKRKIMILYLIIFFILISIIPKYTYSFGVGDIGATETHPGRLDVSIGSILGIISTIGSVISVLVLVILGIKYMLGSIEEKAEYKKSMLPYIIGAILLFAATTLVRVIYRVAINIK